MGDFKHGRPATYETVESFQKGVDAYFKWIEGEFTEDQDEKGNIERSYTRQPEPATITGMCLYLGFESRQSFHDYAEREGFSYVVKTARLRIENAYELALNRSKVPTAQIFALKNLGWSDKQEVSHDYKGQKEIIVKREIVNGPNDDATKL